MNKHVFRFFIAIGESGVGFQKAVRQPSRLFTRIFIVQPVQYGHVSGCSSEWEQAYKKIPV
jgi:hypothetical protein